MEQPKIEMIGLLDIKGMEQIRRVYHPAGIAPTLTTCGGGQRQVKVLDLDKFRVRKLKPIEYGRLQAFNMDSWVQVVSDSQAYKQFGNAVTVSLFEAVAHQVKKAIGKQRPVVNDFFCGCGGMGTAFLKAGFAHGGAWDFDKYAIQSYQKNVHPNATLADIRKMTWEDIPGADTWTFGFPCQDLSVAGKQKGLVLECEDCGEEFTIDPETYTGNADCPKCGGKTKSKSRSGCFFEMMRLLDEVQEHTPEYMPAVILAENVKGVKPYLGILEAEYKKRGYTAHIQMFNSKYWGVAQSRERFAIVGTRDDLNLEFEFPEEQHNYIPPLSDFMEKNVEEKYYIPDDKARTIIEQALERLESLGKIHPCITPDRVNKRQNGRRAKGEDEPMFTLTAQDLHGVIVYEGNEEELKADICKESGLLNPDGCGKTLRVGGGRKPNEETQLPTHFSDAVVAGISASRRVGKGKEVYVGIAPTLLASDNKGPVMVIEQRKGENMEIGKKDLSLVVRIETDGFIEKAQAVADARRALDKALDDLEDFIIAHTTTERKENAT